MKHALPPGEALGRARPLREPRQHAAQKNDLMTFAKKHLGLKLHPYQQKVIQALLKGGSKVDL
jgi:hypothetical protein